MKKLLVLSVLLIAFSHAYARQISEAEALATARLFMKGKTIAEPSLSRAFRHAAQAQPYYVFNVADAGGYVIVSGDDRAVPVLGYALSGTFDADDMPPAMAVWLEEYAREITYAQENDLQPVGEQAPAAARTAIPKLIQSKWNQRYPYNCNCPQMDGQYCLTGCVATALAQIMRYYEWPQGYTTDIPGYTTETNQIEMPPLPATTFDWQHMTDTYERTASMSGSDVIAVVRLMEYCGTAVEANYDKESTGAISRKSVRALREYFGYGNGVKWLDHVYWSDADWEEVVYQELLAGRPLIYSGRYEDEESGHTFIVHGYDGNGFFAINWGWGGNKDGYFRLSALHLDNDRDYSYRQRAVVGISPDDVAENVVACIRGAYIAAPNVSKPYQAESFEYAGQRSDGGSVRFSYSFRIFTQLANSYSFDLGLGLLRDDQLVGSVERIRENMELPESGNGGYYINGTRSIGNGLAKGEYVMKLYSREHGTDDWQPCQLADHYAVAVSVTDRQILLTVTDGTTAILPVMASPSRRNPASTDYNQQGLPVDASYKGIVITPTGDGRYRKVVRR